MRRSWIKIETNTPDKPEVCILASQLRMDADAVMGKLVRLWAWAELNVSKNNETSVTLEFLDKVVGKKGFSAALLKAGWLKETSDGLEFPNFGRHNGRDAKGRAQTALRVSRHRAQKVKGVTLETTSSLDAQSLAATLIIPQEVGNHIIDDEHNAFNADTSRVVENVVDKELDITASTVSLPDISVTDATFLIAETLAAQEAPSSTKRSHQKQSKENDEQPLLF